MEDFGGLVYYILVFAIAMIGWISSSARKKQQHRTVVIPSPSPTQGMPVVFPAVPGKRKQRPPPVPKKNRQAASSDSFLSSKYREETLVLLEEDPISIAEELDLNNVESFRKAIIYSEILNRKEW